MSSSRSNFRASSRSRKNRKPLPKAVRRAFFEALEDRSLMATFTWDGGGGADTNWLTAANWTLDSLPAVDGTADLVFTGGTSLTNVNNFPAATTFNSITFDASAGNFTITGNQITLNGGTDIVSLAGTQTLNTPFAMGTASTVNVTAGSLSLGGIISGAGSLTKIGAAGLTLANINNAYTGNTSINEGTLSAADVSVTAAVSSLGNSTNAVTIGTATTVGTLNYTGAADNMTRGITLGTLAASATGSTLNIAGNVDLTASGIIAGGAPNAVANTSLSITGAGRLIPTNAGNTFTGNVVVDAARISVSATTVLGTTAVGEFKNVTLKNGATQFVTASMDPGNNTTTTDKRIVIGAGGGTVDIGSTFTYTLNDAAQFSSVGGATDNLTLTGAGTLTLGQTALGYSAFPGTIIVNGAILSSPALHTFSGGVRLTSGTLVAGNSSTVAAGAVTGSPFGLGALTINGGTFRSDGTARTIQNPTTIGGNFTFGGIGFANLTLDPSTVTGGVTTITGTPTITVPVGAQTIAGRTVTATTITKQGVGALVLNNATGTPNSITTATVNAGALVLGTQNALAGGLGGITPANLTVDAGATLSLGVGAAAGQFTNANVDTVLSQLDLNQAYSQPL